MPDSGVPQRHGLAARAVLAVPSSVRPLPAEGVVTARQFPLPGLPAGTTHQPAETPRGGAEIVPLFRSGRPESREAPTPPASNTRGGQSEASEGRSWRRLLLHGGSQLFIETARARERARREGRL